jgi:hypothetical protein
LQKRPILYFLLCLLFSKQLNLLKPILLLILSFMFFSSLSTYNYFKILFFNFIIKCLILLILTNRPSRSGNFFGDLTFVSFYNLFANSHNWQLKNFNLFLQFPVSNNNDNKKRL